MENNQINNENICVLSAEKKHAVNKKAMLFISLSVIIPTVVEKLGMSLLLSFVPDMPMQGNFSVISPFFSAFVAVLGLVLILIFTSKLTENKTEAIYFLSVYAMGSALGTIVQSILSFILEIFFPSTKMPASVIQGLLLTVSIIGAIATVIFACLLYNNLIEKNTITPVSPTDHSKIKKNMIFAYISIILVTAALTSVISIINLLDATRIIPEEVIDELYYNNFFSVLAKLINALTSAAVFGILYLFGYKQRKSREDGLNFASCYYFPTVFTLVVSSILSAVLNLLTTNTDSIATTAGIIASALSFIISIALMVAEIILVFYALKHIFPVQHHIEEEYPAEETYADEFYVEPSHIENAEIEEMICINNSDANETPENDLTE